VHACAHVTGGGIAGNLARVLPPGCGAVLDRRAWEVPRIFGEIERLGEVAPEEMDRVFNLGLGMVLVVAAAAVDAVTGAVAAHGRAAPVVGEVRAGDGGVTVR
ncbi:MAG: AIR synthase-related protein, partial [Acidimicrobiales bacterium]